MRFHFNQVAKLLSDIKDSKTKSLLLYGSNQGMVSWLTRQIKLIYQNVVELDNADSDKQLIPALHATNLFGEQEAVIYHYSSSHKLNAATLGIIKQNQYPNFALWITDNLNTSSEVYKIFESAQNLGLMSCYDLNTEQTSGFITHKIVSKGKKITPEALSYLAKHVQPDPLIIENELTKLFTYLGDNDQSIGLEDVKANLSKNIEANADLLFFYLVEGKAKLYLELLDQLQEAAIPDLWVLRSLIRYFGYIYDLKLDDRSCSIDQKIRLLDPPVFFKYRTYLGKYAALLSFELAAQALLQLSEMEIDLKSKSNCGYQALKHLIISQNYSRQHAT